MDCIKNDKTGAEILTGYCAGKVDPAIAAQIESHLEDCAACKKTVDGQRAVWEMLDAWTPHEVSSDFDARLYARIAAEQSRPVWRRWWSRLFQPAVPQAWWKPAASLAVAAAIVSLVVVARLPQPGAPIVTTPVAQVSSSTAPTPSAQASAAKQTGAVKSAPSSAPGSEDIDLQQIEQALDDLEILAPAGQSAL